MPPFISIITATYNARDVLPRLLDSLVEQAFRDFELIIQDGASTDETLTVAESYREKLPHLSIESCPDNGIYDAWNSALDRATGEWILFLGADDRLHSPSSLAQIAPELENLPPHVDFLATSLELCLSDFTPIEIVPPQNDPYSHLPSTMPVPHPALFHRRSLFTQHRFTTTLRIAGDYEFLCNTMTASNIATSTSITTSMRVGGISGSLPTLLKSELECLQVSRRYFPQAKPYKLYARIIRSFLYLVIARVAGEDAGYAFGDFVRKLQGKPPLWKRIKTSAAPQPPLSNQPLISLLIATVHRTTPLAQLLQSLAAQTHTHFEVIIADQNPPQFLESTLAPYKNILSIQQIAVPNQGVSQARNAILPLAQGEIIAFPDDDCWYAPNALQQVVAYFSQHPHIAGLLTGWAPAPTITPAQPRITPVNSTQAFRNAGTLVQFYRADALKDIRFDPELGPGTSLPYGCGEDTDFLLQVMAQNKQILRTSEVFIYHPKPNLTDPNLPQKAYAYALGRMHLLRKHKLPLWFKLANVCYPLAKLPLEGPKAFPYRKAMFLGRLKGLFQR